MDHDVAHHLNGRPFAVGRAGTLPPQRAPWQGRRVNAPRPSRPNAYTGNPLDRGSARREDEVWLAQSRGAACARVTPIWRARSLMRGVAGGQPAAVYLTGGTAAALLATDRPWAFLGYDDAGAVFTVDLSAADEPLALLPPDTGEFVDLRAVPGLLPAHDAAVLAHARGLMHWRSRHLFCGVCGSACMPRQAGHVMGCTGCNAQHFPRTDPAVIMLVTHGDRALLGHSQRFPNSRMYSTLAGFVEPGESLEEAVAREVLEESGVRVGAVHYHSSQPWPFPASIMLGFYAEALTEEITIDPAEIADAQWFTRDQMRNCDAHGFALPRSDSIASRLIDDWINAA